MRNIRKSILSIGIILSMIFSLMLNGTLLNAQQEFIPALEAQAGILAEYFHTNAYRGGPMELYNFENKTGEKTLNVLNGSDLRPDFQYFNGSGDYGTARFTSRLKIDRQGLYTFYGFGDDGFRVWIDGELIIDFWKGEWEVWQQSEPIELTAGFHDVKIEYLQGWGGAMLQFYWESEEAGISKAMIPASAYFQPEDRQDLGLTAQIYKCKEYANNIIDYKFEGELSKTVLESLDGSDLSAVLQNTIGRTEYASGIIHGFIVPEATGDYKFAMSGDDAYRLWINDQLAIDSWKLNSTNELISNSIHLLKGKLYKIRINYAQAKDNSNLKLSWKNGDGPLEVISTSCLRQGNKELPDDNTVIHGLLAEIFSGTYLDEKKGEKVIPEISKGFGWSNLFKEFNGSSEYGSIRFTGQLKAEQEGDYTFYMIGDDGFRLWVNGELIIDFWEAKWDIQKESNVIHLNEGMNDIRIEFFQGYGGTYLTWEWSQTGFENRVIVPSDYLYPASTEHGLRGEVFACNEDGSNEVKTGEILSEQLNYNKEDIDTLLNLCNSDTKNSKIKWSGIVIPAKTGEYKISLGTNGTYRVALDSEDIISFENAIDYVETMSDSITLTKGKTYHLLVEAILEENRTNLDLFWELEGKKEVIPASVLYSPDSIWYDKTLVRNELYQVLIDAMILNNNTTVGEEVGQTNTEAKYSFETVISMAAITWKDFDESSENLKLMTATLNNAIAAFKANIVMPNDGTELTQFNNALYQGQDPFITYHDGYYYFVSSSNDPGHNKMYVSKSKSLLDQGEKVMVYDSDGIESRLFAPELYFIDGKWYIYYCADVGLSGYNWRHMACVLESVTDDPQGEWIDRGVLYTGTNGVNQQANDFNVFEYRGQLYACWGTLESGIGGPALARMESPIKISDDRSFLPPDGGEGPRAIVNGDRLFITVSHGNFKSTGYHLGMYTFDNTKEDILNPDNWSSKQDVFHGTKEVYGPARASFFKSADGTENWMAFHSKVYPTNNNAWRQVSIKQFTFNEEGTPNFGTPVSPYEFINLPSGDPGLGLIYQSEAAVNEGGASKDYFSKGFQGSGYVKIPSINGAKVTFNVNVENAGDYFIRVRYANGVKASISNTDPRGEWEAEIPDITPKKGTLVLNVNGIRTAVVGFDKTETDWQHWMYSCNRVTLNGGSNEITFIKNEDVSGDIYIDYIGVQEAHQPPEEKTKRTQAELNTLINEAQEKEESLYSIDSWTLFASSLETARKENPSDLALSIRYLSLKTAMDELSANTLLTVENSSVKDAAPDNRYEIGKEITVTAIAPTGMKFIKWNAKGVTLSEEDTINEVITFIMPRNRVTLIPEFEINTSEPDAQKPSTPTNIIVTNIGAAQGTLSWNDSTDNVGVIGYMVTLDKDDQIRVVSGSSIQLINLFEDTEYTASIIAVDEAGNQSEPGIITFTTAKNGALIDREKPSIPDNIIASNIEETTALLTWDESTDNVGVTSYQVSLDKDNQIHIVSGASIQLNGLGAGAKYTATIIAMDAAGNQSDPGILSFITKNASIPSYPTDPVDHGNNNSNTNTSRTITKEDNNTKIVTTIIVKIQEGGSKVTEIESVVTDKVIGTKITTKITIGADGKIILSIMDISFEKSVTNLEKEKASLRVKMEEEILAKMAEQLSEVIKDATKVTLKEIPFEVTINISKKEAIELIHKDNIKNIIFNVEIPENSFLTIHKLILSKEILEAAKKDKTSIIVSLEDTKGKELYSISLDGSSLNASKSLVTDLNLALQIAPTKSKLREKDFIVKVIQKDKNNSVPKSVVLTFNHKEEFPVPAKVRIYALTDSYIKPSSKVYLYSYNHKIKKLEELPNNSYKVGKDGYITLEVNKGSDYVLLPKKPSKDVMKALAKGNISKGR